MEYSAFKLVLLPKLAGVYQIAVMCDSHRTLYVSNHKRLCVGAVGVSRCGVPHVSHRNISMTEICKSILVENLVNKSQILVVGEHSPVVDNYSAGLLSPVLQCVQTDVGLHSRVHGIIAVDSKHSAFLMYRVKHRAHSFPFQQ